MIAVGAISTYDDVNSVLLAGRADLVALGRTHLYDPQWTLHAAAEQEYHGAGPNGFRSSGPAAASRRAPAPMRSARGCPSSRNLSPSHRTGTCAGHPGSLLQSRSERS